jgi:hypothetical protein
MRAGWPDGLSGGNGRLEGADGVLRRPVQLVWAPGSPLVDDSRIADGERHQLIQIAGNLSDECDDSADGIQDDRRDDRCGV